MENFAATLTGDERKKFRLYAYASTWFGCFSDVMIDSSAILILFFTILGSSNSMLMLMTSLVGIAHLVFMFPGAGMVNKLGPKKVVAISCYVGMCSFLLLAAAPFFGSEIAKYVAFFGCFIYCLTKALWPSAWYPILNSILLPSDRAGFFGFMRFTYLLITGTVFGILGVCMSKNTPEWVFQIVIAVVGVMIMGRYYFLEKIRLPEFARGKLELAKGLKKTVRNSTLLGFSVYVCFLFFSFSAVIPLTLVYLKKGFGCGDDFVQIVSVVGMAGQMFGYLFYSPLVKLLGLKRLQLLTHTIFIIVPFGIFLCGEHLPNAPHIIPVIYAVGTFAYACFWCWLSQEILAIARPDNMHMASAFVQTYWMIGHAFGRIASAIMLGGMLAPLWTYKIPDAFGDFAFSFCDFQTIFFFFGALSTLCLVMTFMLPSAVKEREIFYNP